MCKVFCHKDISSHLWPSVECYFDPVVFCECWEGVTKSFEHSSWLRTSWNMNGMLQVFVTLLKYIFYDVLVTKLNFNSNGYSSENVHFWVQSIHNSDPTHILNSRKSKHLVFIIMKMQGKIIQMKKYPMVYLVKGFRRIKMLIARTKRSYSLPNLGNQNKRWIIFRFGDFRCVYMHL